MTARRAVPALVMLVAWQVAALLAASTTLPSPAAVLACLWQEAVHGPLLVHLAATLGRVSLCFALAMVLGGIAGVAMGLSPQTDHWLDPWLQLLLTLPAMVVAILCYVWMGLGEAAAITAVTMAKLPNVVVILRQGVRQRDRDLAEMAQLFRFPPLTRLRHLVLPELAPYVLAAARTGLSLVWKIVLLVELLGRSDGIGFQLNVYFQLFDMPHLLAYAASFMTVMQAVELTLMTWSDRYVARWQR